MKAADANIFLYAFDDAEPVKQVIAQQLLKSLAESNAEAVLLFQACNEVLANLRRWSSKGKLPADQVEVKFQLVRSLFSLALPSSTIFTRSLDLYSKFSLSHWDSMLLAAAKEAGVTTLYSEDMAHGCDYDGVTVVNPFLVP